MDNTPALIAFFVLAIIGSVFLAQFGVPTLDKVLAWLSSLPGILFLVGLVLVLPMALGMYAIAGLIGIFALPIMLFTGMMGGGKASIPTSNTPAPSRTQSVDVAVVGVTVQVVQPCGGCKQTIQNANVYRCKNCGIESCWREDLGGILGGGEGCMLHATGTLNVMNPRAQDTCRYCGKESNHPWSSNFDYVRSIKA